MHARITWGRVKEGRWDEYEAAYRELLLGHEEEIPGLRGRLLVRDLADQDAGGTVSLWDDAEAAQAYDGGDLRAKVMSRFEGLFSGDFVTHICEVRSSSGEFELGRD
jgi:heme-degrading monooxygenase HmoA